MNVGCTFRRQHPLPTPETEQKHAKTDSTFTLSIWEGGLMTRLPGARWRWGGYVPFVMTS